MELGKNAVRVGRGIRATVSLAAAAVAVVAAAPGAVAFADTSLPTPLGTLAVGGIGDSAPLGVSFTGAGPLGGTTPLAIGVDKDHGLKVELPHAARVASTVQPTSGRTAGSRASTPLEALAPKQAADPASAAPALAPILNPLSAAVGQEPTALVWNLVPSVLGVADGLLDPHSVAGPVAGPVPAGAGVPALAGLDAAGIAESGLAAALGSLTGATALGDSSRSLLSGSLQGVDLALGTLSGLDAPNGPRPGLAPERSAPATTKLGSALAATGTPLVAALAGFVLLVMGGLLTWKRARSL